MRPHPIDATEAKNMAFTANATIDQLIRRLRCGEELSSSNLTAEPVSGIVVIDNAIATASEHWYGDGYRVDRLEIVGERNAYARLAALLAIQLLRSDDEQIFVKFSHSGSWLAGIVIDAVGSDVLLCGSLETGAKRFVYDKSTCVKHPWKCAASRPEEMPCMQVIPPEAASSFDVSALDMERPIGIGFGRIIGTARMISLLLDFSDESNDVDEIELESAAGFCGVAPASWELRLWLPGSIMWPQSNV